MTTWGRPLRSIAAWLQLFFVLLCLAWEAPAQLFTNLQRLVFQIPTGNPLTAGPDKEGPKGIATCDFDGDGNNDLAVSDTGGRVTVYFGEGTGRFGEPIYLDTGKNSLRGIVCADFNGDTRPDIATAGSGGLTNVFLFFYQDGRHFAGPVMLPAWPGARNLATGDFDGDGLVDLVVAGPNLGLRQYRARGDGTFEAVADFPAMNFTGRNVSDSRPVYALRTMRPPGAVRDQLVVTHAETVTDWFLAANAAGVLEVVGSMTNRAPAHALALGPILHPAGNPTNDLVTVQRDRGTIAIHAGTGTSIGFAPEAHQELDLPDPRALEIIDLDKDGWNDLVVVLRNLDKAVAYANSNGVLHLASERPVGSSPREIVSADFDHDSNPDVAVMNRDSSDVTILLGYPQQVGFSAVDHLYLVDGNVAGVAVADFNRDGYDDVIQLHRASGDFSVWLMDTNNGVLKPPVYYTIGDVPGSQIIAKVNSDPIPDLVAANLGIRGLQKSSVSVRLGNGDGTFGPEQRFELPDDVEGRLFALVPADFDGDGAIDLAAGFLDSKVAFFRGHGDGSFTFTRRHSFVRLARGIVAGDFDGDGDADLAGVGVEGELWVVENQGNLLSTPALQVTVYPSPDPSGLFRTIKTVDLNEDGHLDLLVGGGTQAFLYTGKAGSLEFQAPEKLAGSTFSVGEIVSGDFDGDRNTNDLAMAFGVLDRLALFSPTNDYALALATSVPASQSIASGDLDGDGLPDLVGSGKVLWIALSSRPSRRTPPLVQTGRRPSSTNVVINELLAVNTAWPVASDGDRLVDWIELYNGSPYSFSLNGWRLKAVSAADGETFQTNEFTFPLTAFFPRGGHVLAYCSTRIRTFYHTGWKLSGDGGTLSLIDTNGRTVDSLAYPAQLENVSYSRFEDGVKAFVFNPFPTPGLANAEFGRVDPGVRFEGVDPETFQPGQPEIRFFASVRTDVAVARLRLIYQRLDNPVLPEQLVMLYDDGLHGDQENSDNWFAGETLAGFPAGAEIQFYVEITDLNDQTLTVPADPEFGLPEQPGNLFSLALGMPRPTLEISELVSQNEHGLLDETNTPDWVEVRNTGPNPVSMTNIVLTHQIGENSRYYFPAGTLLHPGQHFVVFCDNNPDQGSLHAPFNLRRTGDQVMLTGLTPSGSRTIIDWVRFGEMQPDEALARLGAGGNFYVTTPTPWAGNITNPCCFAKSRQGTNLFIFAFPTQTNLNYQVDFTPSLTPPDVNWTVHGQPRGDGVERVYVLPLEGQGYFRVITNSAGGG